MNTSMPPMPIYAYEPAAYTLSGLSISGLSSEIQKYLLETRLLSPESACISSEDVDRIRRREGARFHRTLLGVHMTLVEHRRQLAYIARTNKDSYDRPKPCDTIDEIQSHVEKVLIPEMRNHYENFIARMDALVWFEVNLRAGTMDAISEREELEYRAFKHTPALRAADERLRSLHDSVLSEDIERLITKRVMQGMENNPPSCGRGYDFRY